jgi:hypothetical protein
VYPVEGGVVAAVMPPHKGMEGFEACFVLDAGVGVGVEQ